MSREIKFRAWDKNRKVWGSPLLAMTSGNIHFDWRDRTIINDDIEVMQFTGLKDKNGKEIYEGDILKSTPGWATFFIDDKREHISAVEFVGSGFKGNYDGTLYNLDKLDMAYTEVIGNIYEHSHLLDNLEMK